MIGSVLALARALVGGAGVAGLVMVWRFVLPAVPRLFSGNLGIGELLLELSLSFAMILAPLALIAFAMRPAVWKFAAMPLVWMLTATIILRPWSIVG
ncbi:MAG: hypothetical protein U1E87_10380 [Alphaproteobacteria bacterium]